MVECSPVTHAAQVRLTIYAGQLEEIESPEKDKLLREGSLLQENVHPPNTQMSQCGRVQCRLKPACNGKILHDEASSCSGILILRAD